MKMIKVIMMKMIKVVKTKIIQNQVKLQINQSLKERLKKMMIMMKME